MNIIHVYNKQWLIAFNFLGTFWNSEASHLSEGVYIFLKGKIIHTKITFLNLMVWYNKIFRTFLLCNFAHKIHLSDVNGYG